MKFDGLLLSKKYIPSAKIYTEDLCNITFNFFVKIHQMTSFLKPYVIFHDTVPYIFLAQTLHTFYKSSLSKWNFSYFPLLVLKLTKLLMSFLEPRASFFSNFASLFSVMRLTLPYFFIKILICFGQKDRSKVQIFRLSTARMKIN